MVHAVLMPSNFPSMAPPISCGRALRLEIDPAILARCQRGDRDAFRLFVLHYQQPVFAFLYRTLGQDHEIDDLAQEVFLRAYRALPRFDPGGAARMSSWLFTIALHLVHDVRRRRAVIHAQRLPRRGTRDAMPTAPATPEADEHRRDIGRAMSRAVAALSEDQRDVFVLAEYHGLGMTELAATLGISENTVKTRLFRARERLRHMLEPLWQEMKP